MTNVADRAKALAELKFAVFPLNLDGTPRTEKGFHDASLDPFYTHERFEKYGDKVKIGVATGPSNLVVLDLDYKEDPTGKVVVDGYDSLEKAWVETPESYAYTSAGGHGRHIWYRAPQGKNLPRKIGYRKMAGVDRCSGDGYVVFNGEDLPDPAKIAEAPQWLQDETVARTAERFEGTVRDWFESLEEGEPNALVRRAIEDIEKLYVERGEDLTHSDIIEAQHRAIRLGAEGNPVTPLIERIEELALSRTGAHSRNPDEYLYEFQEGLLSGIEKHGAAISLRAELPAYSLSLVPTSVPDRLISGEPGDRETFRELLASLLAAGVDDLTATSVLWNSPRTKALARDWGLEFCHKRVQEARIKPEPVRENPTLVKDVAVAEDDSPHSDFLTAKELARVTETPTFIDDYIISSESKGFVNTEVAIPAAWMCLSMAFGTKAYVPIGATPLEMNVWFTILAGSGTGKTSEGEFMLDVLNVFMANTDVHYSMSANSSPEGMETDLLQRDGLATLIYEDEASSFFLNLRTKDWMNTLSDRFARWYNGWVKGSTKLSLKELRGKNARTSLSSFMAGTPERLIGLVDASMFASGFMARTNWVWCKPAENPDAKYDITFSETTEKRVNPVVFSLATDLIVSSTAITSVRAMVGTDAATARLVKAYKAFDKKAQKHRRYESIEPSLVRLRETLLKCAALLALYRGADKFDTTDVLLAISHAEVWFKTLLRVADEIAESPYSRDLEEFEKFIADEGGSVLRSTLLHQFRGKVLRSQREIDDRLGYLMESGRVLRVEIGKEIGYQING